MAKTIEEMEIEAQRLWDIMEAADAKHRAARSEWSEVYSELEKTKLIEQVRAQLIKEQAAKA